MSIAGRVQVRRTGAAIQGCGEWNSNRQEAMQREKQMMTKLEAVIQPSRFEAVKEILTEIGIGGMTVSDVRGHGRQKGHTESYRGREYSIDLLPKVKIEMVLAENQVDAAVDAILKTASTGKIGDGKIFLSKVEEVIRIRSQERGVSAL
jgi:nitrogen regulatory protein P-II 1